MSVQHTPMQKRGSSQPAEGPSNPAAEEPASLTVNDLLTIIMNQQEIMKEGFNKIDSRLAQVEASGALKSPPSPSAPKSKFDSLLQSAQISAEAEVAINDPPEFPATKEPTKVKDSSLMKTPAAKSADSEKAPGTIQVQIAKALAEHEAKKPSAAPESAAILVNTFNNSQPLQQLSILSSKKYTGVTLEAPANVYQILQAVRDMSVHFDANRERVYFRQIMSYAYKEHIITKQWPGHTVEQFNMLDDDVHYKMILASIRVTSRLMFISILMKFPKEQALLECRATLENFSEDIVSLLITHASKFQQVHEILASKDEAIIPLAYQAEKSPGGGVVSHSSVGLFLNSFPNQWGHEIHKLIAKRNPSGFREYITLFNDTLVKLGIIADQAIPLMLALRAVAAARRDPESKPSRLAAIAADECDEELEIDQDLAALQTAKSKDQDLGCFKQTISGDCAKGNSCEYSHQPHMLEKTRLHLIEQYTNRIASLKKRSFSSARPPMPGKPPSLHAMAEPTSLKGVLRLPRAPVDEEDPDYEADMIEENFSLISDSNIPSPLQTRSDIVFPSGCFIMGCLTNLDTGATADYMSLKYFNSNKQFLQSSARPLKKAKTIKFGDGTTMKKVLFTVTVSVRLVRAWGDNFIPTVALCSFYVIDQLAFDMIIGAESLTTSYLDHFEAVLAKVVCTPTHYVNYMRDTLDILTYERDEHDRNVARSRQEEAMWNGVVEDLNDDLEDLLDEGVTATDDVVDTIAKLKESTTISRNLKRTNARMIGDQYWKKHQWDALNEKVQKIELSHSDRHAIDGLTTIDDATSESGMIVNITLPFLRHRRFVHTKGLLDSGAQSASYMSTSFYRQHEDLLKPYARAVDKKVRLGDGETTKDIKLTVTMKLRFHDPKNSDPGVLGIEEHVIVMDVFDTSHDIIIGLPVLSTTLYDYFLLVLRHSRDLQYEKKLYNSLSIIEPGDLVKPFAFRADEAPEDLNTPLPGHYQDALYFLSVPYDERVKDYRSLFDSHIDPEFAQNTKVLELLETKGMQVFIASNWNGINGIPEIEYQFRDPPVRMTARARTINPRLAEHARAELERLQTYLLVPSTSGVVSPIVVAPKATAPFIRICGDFTGINRYIIMPHVPIPNVKHSLEKISKFKIFLDVDVTNAFHQFKLGEYTSNMLSIITPFGTFRPLFMLEGTSPSTGILHSTMCDIFRPCEEWTIVLFDNILILADNHEDAYSKFEKFLDICISRNLFLKFEKSWLGVKQVDFFGYICVYQSYRLSEKRMRSIMEIPMPESQKQAQALAGCCIFFQNFVPYFSDIMTHIYALTVKGFDFKDKSKWPRDYEQDVELLKKAICEAQTLFYPDYDLPWILRVDASKLGVGGVLLQDPGDGKLQPIMFVSSKFSPQAENWSTIEQEAYAIYYAVFTLSYYLRCKEFVIETDHRNLLFMHHSKVPKIIRWYIYLQSYNFLVRHIAGKQNIVADMLSRQWNSTVKEFEDTLCHISDFCNVEDVRNMNTDSLLRQVHGRRRGHLGIKRTWFLLNKLYPGHSVTVRAIQDFIAECPVCQKERLQQVASIPSVVKTLHVDHAHSTVGVDTLEIVLDSLGNQYLLVMVNFFTKYVYLYAVVHKDAITTATCIFHYICTFGLFDFLRSDPGSDFTSEVMEHLLQWLGPTRSLTLAKQPQADGVEGSNKQVLRHLRAICMEEDCRDRWSSPTILPIVQLIMNEHIHSETGVAPMVAQFGDADAIYSQIPAGIDTKAATHAYVRLLRDNLQLVRQLSKKHQDSVKEKRVADSPPGSANYYKPGEYVLFHSELVGRRDKLSPRSLGPYKVLSHDPSTNWVEVRDLVYDDIKTFDRKDLILYVDSDEGALLRARQDASQYEIDCIVAHRGNPETRQTMEFLVRFMDSTEIWMPWSKDIDSTLQYGNYCNSLPQLRQLALPAAEAKKLKTSANNSEITLIGPHYTVYVDIREWGPGTWYQSLHKLPDKDTKTYVIEGIYGKFCGTKSKPHSRIELDFPVLRLKQPFIVDNWFVTTYGHQTKLQDQHILLSASLIKQYSLKLD